MCAKRAKQSFYAAQTARGIRSRVVPYRVPKNGRYGRHLTVTPQTERRREQPLWAASTVDWPHFHPHRLRQDQSDLLSSRRRDLVYNVMLAAA